MQCAYTAAPDMKNHLSYMPSIGAGGRSCPLGMFRSPSCSRCGECGTVILALEWPLVDIAVWLGDRAHSEILPGGVLPVTSFSQESAHSRTTSVAYL